MPGNAHQCFERGWAEDLLDRFANHDRKNSAQLLRHARECGIHGDSPQSEIVRQRGLELLVQTLAQTQIKRDLQLPACL